MGDRRTSGATRWRRSWSWSGSSRTTRAATRTSSAAASGSASGSRARSSSSRTCSSATSRSARSTSAIQAQVLNLLRNLQRELGPHLPLRRPQHGRRRAHQRPGGGDVPRHAWRSSPRRPTSIASRCTRTRIALLSAVPVRGSARTLEAEADHPARATSRRPSTRRPAAASTPAAGCASSSATRSAAPPSGRQLRELGPGHGVACHFAEAARRPGPTDAAHRRRGGSQLGAQRGRGRGGRTRARRRPSPSRVSPADPAAAATRA